MFHANLWRGLKLKLITYLQFQGAIVVVVFARVFKHPFRYVIISGTTNHMRIPTHTPFFSLPLTALHKLRRTLDFEAIIV